MSGRGFGWLAIARLGLVQAALGGSVAFSTYTLNRVMVVEFALPAIVPGALVAWHYALQLMRPRFGHGSDVGGRRTPWIVGGMALLAAGTLGATAATVWLGSAPVAAILLAVLSFTAIGLGVGAAGTANLVLLAQRVHPQRRGAGSALVWITMIVGIVITAGLSGHLLEPFSLARLMVVGAGVACGGLALALAAVWRLEPHRLPAAPASPRQAFVPALREAWQDPQARRFTLFVFVSMLAFNAQELLLEPFAGAVFHLSPGASTKLIGVQHQGVLVGMLLFGLVAGVFGKTQAGGVGTWTVGGCLASALAIAGLAAAGPIGPAFPLWPCVVALGIGNGAFTVAAVGAMMQLAGRGGRSEGVRMGLWGAAQAIAAAAGGLAGTGATDVARLLLGSPMAAYAAVFSLEALTFIASAVLAARVFAERRTAAPREDNPAGPRHCGQRHYPGGNKMNGLETFDVVVVGGGPCGATAAADLAAHGRSVLLLDRGGRIKPCGGAIPPRLVKEFDIPDELMVAKVQGARIFSPKNKRIDMPIEGGYVGMVDRDGFDEWLRERAAGAGAVRRTGTFTTLERETDGVAVVCYTTKAVDGGSQTARVRARSVIGADGAISNVARQCLPGGDKTPFVFAYHEIVRSPTTGAEHFDGTRCDVYYRGKLSPDFYGWVFPHGDTTSVGTGSAHKGFSLRGAVGELRASAGLGEVETIRREGAPIPLKPLRRWDNGRDVVVAGDAAGVVAPASGEGIYYAMLCGRLAAGAVEEFCTSGNPKALRNARKRFMGSHGQVFWVLGIMQRFWYANDKRRERFVAICGDRDVQQLTWQGYMNKALVRAKPIVHMRIFVKNIAHLTGLAPT